MEMKRIDENKVDSAIALIWTTFLQFEAPDYTEEGIQSFRDIINSISAVSLLRRSIIDKVL